MTTRKKDGNEWGKKFFNKIIFGVLLLPLIMWAWPWIVPFNYFEFWKMRGSVGEWFLAARYMFAWGTGVSILAALASRNKRSTNREAETIIIAGTFISILAGVVEELTFRWIFFLGNIVSVKISNFLFFGFLGFGVAEWIHLNILGPLADWTTLRVLEPFLFHKTGWAVGAAMLTTTAFFRNGHKYLGWFGYVNSWFLGMFLFWIMFQYGMLAAIFVHFLYDFLIYLVRYLDAAIERALGHV